MKHQNNSQLPIFLIAIDGHGGCGKSTLAKLLSEKFGAEIIHTDDFAGWDNPKDWWPLVIERIFEPIKRGDKLLNYPRSKWWETHNPEPVVDQPVTPVMILEGVSSLRKDFRPYISYGIFVDTPKELCLHRGFERDRGQDSKSDEKIMKMWEQWYKDEETYIKRDDPKEYADLIVDGTKPFEEQVEQLLFQTPKAQLFDEDAELYDKMRPNYPDSLFERLREHTMIDKQSRILEVGCGTGQATASLMKISQKITCIDPGKKLLALAESKFPDLQFVSTTFEDFETNDMYDAIVSATAWHWVNPKVGYKKAHRLLKEKGSLIILHTYHIETDTQAFHNQAQFIYSKYSNRSLSLGSRQPIEDTAKALKNKYFEIVEQSEESWQQTYSTEQYLALRNTYSDHRFMSSLERKKFETELRDFTNSQYGGKVTKNYTSVLFIARKR